MKSLALLLVVGLVDGFFFPKIKTVEQLDINRYTGRWYEMYNSLFQRLTFERNSYCTSATYTLRPDGKVVNVLNSGNTGSATGPVNDINGTVYQTNPDNAPGELIVSFPSAPQSKKANYLVIKLGPATYGSKGEYQYTVITSPGKIFSWILARDVTLFREKYEAETLQFLKENGYNSFYNKPKKTYHEKDCVYPKQSVEEVIVSKKVVV